MIGNIGNNPVYRRVSLPIYMFNKTRKISLKEKRNVMKERIYRPDLSRLIDPSNDSNRVVLHDEVAKKIFLIF